MLWIKWIIIALLSVLYSFRGYWNGRFDGRLGVGSDERKRSMTGLFGAAKAKLAETFQASISDASNDVEHLSARRDQLTERVDKVGPPRLPILAICGAGPLFGLFFFAEAAAVAPLTAVFGLKPTEQFLFGLTIVLVITVSTDLAFHDWGTNRRFLAGLIIPVVIGQTFAVVEFRLGYLKVVEAGRYPDGVWLKLLEDYGTALAVLLTALTILFAYLVAKLLRDIGQSVNAHVLAVRLSRTESKLARKKKLLRKVEIVYAKRREQLDHLAVAAEAEHSRGVLEGATKAARWEEFDPLRAALTMVVVGGLSTLAATGISLALWPQLGPVSLLIAIVSGVVLFAGAMLVLLPRLKKPAAPQQLKLALPTIALLALSIPATLTNISCARVAETGIERGEVVILLDRSRSVHVADEDLTAAVLTAVSLVKPCWRVTVAPVNAGKGEMLETTIPCQIEGFGDNVQAAQKRFHKNLLAKVRAWRENDELSNYEAAFQFAGERIGDAKLSFLIVLGDLVHDVGNKTTTATVPGLPGLSLPGTRVYLGLLQSTEFDRLPARSQTELLDAWETRLKAAGAREVKLKRFGLQVLGDWSAKEFAIDRLEAGVERAQGGAE